MENLLSRWLIPNRFYGDDSRKDARICVIEFDDQGELWDPKQLDETIARIQYVCQISDGGSNSKESGKPGEVIVITFTHGWMHNASSEDRNFELFSNLIEARMKAEESFAKENNRRPRPIIGVYLAWRGLLWDIPILKYFTFWSRKSAALRVGNLSCTEVLFRIMRAVKSRNSSSQCIFVGHSFGGLIIESAICKALLGAIFQRNGEAMDFPSDLVVLINPACDAICAKQFIDILNRNRIIIEMGGITTKDDLTFPILISITSANDKATKWAFPFGQFFVGLFKSFRKYDDEIQKSLPSQRHLYSHTAGHVSGFHNYKVQPVTGDGGINTGKLVFSANREGTERYEIAPIKNGLENLPFWLMQAPREVVPNHSEIFTDALANMLYALLHWSTTSVEPTKIKCNTPEAGTMAKAATMGSE